VLQRLHSLIDVSLHWCNKFGKFVVYKCEMTQVQTLLKYITGMLANDHPKPDDVLM
jgi:hypothetical protein